MAANIHNRSLTAAAIVLAAGAGVFGVGSSAAKGDIDWSISLNLGYSNGGSSYWGGGWGGCNSWYTPRCYRPYYAPYYYSPWYGGYYTNGYYFSTPQYAFSTPLYMPSGTTFVYSSYSPWGSGFTYTTTTYYTPYSNYYAPAGAWNFWPSAGLTLNFWDNDHDDHHHHGHDNHHGHDWDHDGHHGRSNTFPTAATGSNLNGKPNTNVAPAETFGTSGPTANGLPGAKGPRVITPVATKPVESKPTNAGKPTLPVLTQTKPNSFEAKPTTGPTAPSKFPQTSAGKPAQTGKPVVQLPESKPTTMPSNGKPQIESKPIVQAPTSKPSLPVLTQPSKAPEVQSDKGQIAGTQGWTKPTTDSPAGKPSTGRPSYRSSTGWSTPSLRTPQSTPYAMPSTAPQSSTPSSMPSGKPTYIAPAPTPRVSTPAPTPRVSSPAPSGKGPSMPASTPSGGNGGKFGGGNGKGR